ncbi:AbrB/MazE/SpoVT family DNA-binding domain-containing protein [Azospirillum sp. RWY-5-1]|uniref:AbrB/MazE/SpoVT family DNA-binding domain-containing protein n=1 Tax=Azospirillum oleiclasticum TaxID=2735135 RepID=A0ABX2TMC8_9PROT|nr:type II toxin-antitoxin system VapB family antitoxin [Azospirillum oleiclasticum]NYZ17009.1 AbrB/MazE/SpoVT family DNA-binding domain-containing protein [Azospirillum oleiclasticum]NYZ24547.1 AbrB/MazE/SpoVT family DNA-binding domain-containing protein [Azospirillum oleiclasticum]
MAITRVFRNGNSQAVRIPADLAFDRNDLEIERVGDELRIRPVPRRLDGLLGKLAAFSDDFMRDGRGEQDQAERDTRCS